MCGEYKAICHGYKHLVCVLTCLMEPVFVDACYSCCCGLAVKASTDTLLPQKLSSILPVLFAHQIHIISCFLAPWLQKGRQKSRNLTWDSLLWQGTWDYLIWLFRNLEFKTWQTWDLWAKHDRGAQLSRISWCYVPLSLFKWPAARPACIDCLVGVSLWVKAPFGLSAFHWELLQEGAAVCCGAGKCVVESLQQVDPIMQ